MALWVGSLALWVVAVLGSAIVEDGARPPDDFVVICRDSVPPIPPPAAGLASRIAALDAMIACTERMEVQYVARGAHASNTSFAIYLLAGVASCFAAVVTWRFVGARQRRSHEPTP